MEPTVHIAEATPIEAWRSAVTALIETSPRFGMTVEIANPTAHTVQDYERLDPARFVSTATPIADVASTIFPRSDRPRAESLEAFFARNKKIYSRWERRSRGRWGTYFGRLTAFGAGAPSVNQLEVVVNALNGWARVQHAALVVHLSAATLDKPKAQGQPCWQFGEFLREDQDTVSLLAVYRSHHYFLKALGNFWGLGRVLDFVAARTNLRVGRIVCVSSYAVLGCSKTRARRMLENA